MWLRKSSTWTRAIRRSKGESISIKRSTSRVCRQEVWNFHIGGYQVCQKWLKDRKGRMLSYEDMEHYQRIVAALSETIQLMEEIDEVIEEHGGWPIK